MQCTVVTDSKSAGIGNGLTYDVGGLSLRPGSHVRVPLRNKLVEGIVLDIIEKRGQETYDLKQIKEVLGEQPLLSEAALKTVRWMSEQYLCPLRLALSVWLPSGPWSVVLPKEIIGYRVSPLAPDAVRGAKQQAVLEYLRDRDWASREQISQETGASSSVLNAMKTKGLLTEEKRKEEFAAPSSDSALRESPVLSGAQEAVYELIKTDSRPSLLFGVTGSGKTEIYAKLIADAVTAGKQAILLLPEILLTEHFIDRFEALLQRPAISILHSRLTPAERRNEWKRIHRGEVSLVIGSRSALFAPLKNLALVILDEEHEWTYKNEQSPRYHARETAETLCRFAAARLLLGSATPSLESWARAKEGRYHLARLPMRYRDQPLPTVRVVDLAEVQFGELYPFSPTLVEAIGARLDRKEQTVLFLNRRGTASALLCLQCRRRVVSPVSQLPFTLHTDRSGKPFLLDHTTGTVAPVPAQCPHCASVKLHSVGAGTQKIELLLKRLFPTARLLRADADTLQDPGDMRKLLQAMRHGEADILLGTQTVVKGLDLPDVTLAAVLIADIGMSLPHFRAGERIFQLLTQLTGRSGRAKPGEVIIQTFRPDSPEIIAAAKHETEKYLETELKLRLYNKYPPASRMVRLIVRGEDCEKRAKKLYVECMRDIALNGRDIKCSTAPTFFGGGKVWHVLLRGDEPRAALAGVDLRGVSVDIDPLETL